MNPVEGDIIQRAGEIRHEYTSLLNEIDELTEKIMDAAKAGDTDELDSLLDLRARVCLEFGQCVSKLIHVLHDLDSLPDGEEQNIRAMLDGLFDLHEFVLDKQTECEKLLSTKISECRNTLMELHSSKGVRAAYGGQPATKQARFLDNKQ